MTKKNNKRHFIKEDKGSLSTMLRAFEDKIGEVEDFDEFDESLDEDWNGIFSAKYIMKHSNITNKQDAQKLSDWIYQEEMDSGYRSKEEFIDDYDFDDLFEKMSEEELDENVSNCKEAREMHTWNVSYVGQGNKIRNHIVDAPDAYEANRKARRELGISYSDIDDVSLVENKEDMNEARELHTWNVTYTGKGNKIKNHIVDAPDAYEANRKARRELGIAYTDIDDITMVENKGITESISNSQANMVYNELKNVFYDFSDSMIETVESEYETYKDMSDEDITFEDWFNETKQNYPDFFKYIVAIHFEDYLNGGY